jgi:hypothetical protein
VNGSTAGNQSYAAYRCFDGLYGMAEGHAWFSPQAGAVPHWISVDIGEVRPVTAYRLRDLALGGIDMPKRWMFQGSNDGLSNTAGYTWTTIDDMTASDYPWTNGEMLERTVSASTYRYYRIWCPASGVSLGYGGIIIGEFEILGPSRTGES